MAQETDRKRTIEGRIARIKQRVRDKVRDTELRNSLLAILDLLEDEL